LKETDQHDQTSQHDKKDQQKETEENQEEETATKEEKQIGYNCSLKVRLRFKSWSTFSGLKSF
jgi:hypothetical protein